VVRAKDKMLAAFDSHLVTKEIEGGPNAGNISGTLNGYGNLFSFIGFYDGDRPTEYIREILNRFTKIENNSALYTRFSSKNTMTFGFRVRTPSLKEIEGVTEYPDSPPWNDGSWAIDMEKKISGSESYLYDEEFGTYSSSRSTTGLQAKSGAKTIVIIRDDIFKPTEYLSPILNMFAKNLGRIR